MKQASKFKKAALITILVLMIGLNLNRTINSVIANTFIKPEEKPVSTVSFAPYQIDAETIVFESLNYEDAFIAESKSKIDSIYADPDKVENVRAYMARRGSPMAAKAQYVVKMASIYGIDYRLVPAISIIESSGCLRAYRPNNCWGLGGQGNAMSFSTLEEGIEMATRVMARYHARGLTTPALMSSTYCMNCPTWAGKVQGVMNDISTR